MINWLAQADKSGSEKRDGFHFRSGWLSLDFTATLTGRFKPSTNELLAAPADLGRWFAAAGFAQLAKDASEKDLLVAREMRETIYTLALSLIEGAKLSQTDRRALNQFAQAETAHPQLDDWGAMRWEGSAPSLLALLAQEAVQLFGSDASERIKQCEAPVCAMLFLDVSRAGDRRWCSMSACGNKAKVAEYRKRKSKGG